MNPLLEHANLDELWTIVHRIQGAHQLDRERSLLASYVETWAEDGVQSILDVGCGNGARTLELSRQFPKARVLGVEVDPALIVEARRACTEAAVEFLAADIIEAPLEEASFDLIHVRFMLHLLTPARRALALEKIARLSHDETVVFAIDHDSQLHLVYPPCRFLTRMRELAARLRADSAVDVELGRRLPSLFAAVGFGDFRFELSCLDLFRIGRSEFLELMMAQARLLAAHVPGAFDETSLGEGQAELEQWIDAGGGLSLGASCCVLGRKLSNRASTRHA